MLEKIKKIYGFDPVEKLIRTEFYKSITYASAEIEVVYNFLLQQKFISSNFNKFLIGIMFNLTNPDHIEIIGENLSEELGLTEEHTTPHRILFLNMIEAIGVKNNRDPATVKTKLFIDRMNHFCRESPAIQGLTALLLGCEILVPQLYSAVYKFLKSKGFTQEQLQFLYLHMGCDEEHAEHMLSVIIDILESHSQEDRELIIKTGYDIANLRCEWLEQFVLTPTMEIV